MEILVSVSLMAQSILASKTTDWSEVAVYNVSLVKVSQSPGKVGDL